MRRLAALSALACGLAAGGCSFQLHSLIGKDDPDAATTGSIVRSGEKVADASDAWQPSEVDLAYARAVASDVLAHGGKDSSVPWENPNTGASGNITPLTVSYTEDGVRCRDFLASYVHGDTQSWLQGAACRTSQGKWEVKRLKPLSRS